jgi:hypothetical protein
MVNIVFAIKKKRPLPPVPNAVVHFIMAAVYIVAASIATAYCVQGYTNLTVDPYGMKVGNGVHTITSVTGKVITVSPANVGTCPAFASCLAQQAWTSGAQKRALVAIIGCIMAGLALYVSHARS